MAARIGLQALKLAVGGTGPGFYFQYPSLIETMNRGRFVILEFMAARHEGNSIGSGTAWRRIVDEEIESARRYGVGSRASWLATPRKLVEAITVPAAFFWF